MTSMTVTSPDSFSAVLGTVLLVQLLDVPQAHVASAAGIDREVDQTLEEFRKPDGADAFLGIAIGALVFPKVCKAPIGLGVEYGEGAPRVDGKTVDYCSTAAAPVGFQLGAQSRWWTPNPASWTSNEPAIAVCPLFGSKIQ